MNDRAERTLTRDQARAFDQWAIETLGAPSAILMENAGRQSADAVCELLGQAGDGPVGVLAGTGANGGDGFVAARHLRVRSAAMRVWLVGAREKVSGAAATNLRLLEALGVEIESAGSADEALLAELRGCSVLVDALGGTGIRGALRGDLAETVERVNRADRPIVAIDIPTGLDCDTGAAEGPAIRATRTVTFVARKAGFDADGAAEYTGEVTVADIGAPLADFPGG
jgi:NAD(P)H-hydrate epimerase